MKTIGRVDKADFPELELRNINVKIDTGAFTSSIHCHDIKEVEINGTKQIEFKLLDPSYPNYDNRVLKTKNYEETDVKSSFGDVEKRFVIKTFITIFGEEYPVQLSLSERCHMKFPILLGRKFLKNRFIVNTARTNISFKLKQKNR